MSKFTPEDLDAQYEEWLKTEDFSKFEKGDPAELRELLINELDLFATMSVQEYTFFQKWNEVKRKFPVKITKKTLFGGPSIVMDSDTKEEEILQLQYNLWKPESYDDYSKLEPELILCEDTDQVRLWTCMRTFASSQVANSNIGRNLRYFVIDKVTKKYLGLFCISSDFMDLSARDTKIGWSREIKTDQRMINHLGIGSTIIPTQPLGYNYVGGKLIALLTLSDEVQNAWKEKYGDVLAGMTTTSLYGTFSQYDRLKHWKKMGATKGATPWEPTWNTRWKLMHWLAHEHPRVYWEYYVATNGKGQKLKRDHKFRSLQFIYKLFDIPKEKILTDHVRGVYFCPFYDNTNEFLRKEIHETELKKSFDTSIPYLTNLWKEKYASKRIKNLVENNRTRDEQLFYSDLIYMTNFEEAKEKYLSLVGEGK